MIFELRIYEAFDGRAEALRRRLVKKIAPILKKHGIESVGFWVSLQEDNCVTYMTRCSDQTTLERGWKGFNEDEEWLRLKQETEPDGPLLKTVVSVRLLRAYPPDEQLAAHDHPV